jgi:hypothetical protein
MDPKIPLNLHVQPTTEIWKRLNQLSPSLKSTFSVFPHLSAVEMTISQNSFHPISSGLLIGSPNAWVIEDGKMVSVEDTFESDGLCDFLWKIGREASFTNLNTWIEKDFIEGLDLISLLILPNLLCIRDAQELEKIAEQTWTGQSSEKINLTANVYCPPITSQNEILINAQAYHISEIFSAELGQNVSLQKMEYFRNKNFSAKKLKLNKK